MLVIDTEINNYYKTAMVKREWTCWSLRQKNSMRGKRKMPSNGLVSESTVLVLLLFYWAFPSCWWGRAAFLPTRLLQHKPVLNGLLTRRQAANRRKQRVKRLKTARRMTQLVQRRNLLPLLKAQMKLLLRLRKRALLTVVLTAALLRQRKTPTQVQVLKLQIQVQLQQVRKAPTSRQQLLPAKVPKMKRRLPPLTLLLLLQKRRRTKLQHKLSRLVLMKIPTRQLLLQAQTAWSKASLWLCPLTKSATLLQLVKLPVLEAQLRPLFPLPGK